MNDKEILKRPVIITANWKMYKTIEEATLFIEDLIGQVKHLSSKIYIAVPFTALLSASQSAEDSPLVIGAQNMNEASEGAFTGEIAGRMLKNAGAQFVILGHSERRVHFQETDEKINLKIKRALKDKLQPVVCIGENLAQRTEGQAKKVVENQLIHCFKDLDSEDIKKFIIAYEPVWAIGTGVVASPEEAQDMHHFCRTLIEKEWGKEVASQIVLQYGGSVKDENAKLLLSQEDIDGLLIGGASLSVNSFIEIIDQVGVR